MEDPETPDQPAEIIPAALPLKEYAIQAKALERAGVPPAYAEMISRVGGTGGLQKFIIREANGAWNDPKASRQLWRGIRLWFLIRFALWAISVLRILPALLLTVFLIGGGLLGIGLVGFIASRNLTKTAAVSDLDAVQVGTKLRWTTYNEPIMGEVTARNANVINIKWQYDAEARPYSNEQLAQDLKTGRIVINRD